MIITRSAPRNRSPPGHESSHLPAIFYVRFAETIAQMPLLVAGLEVHDSEMQDSQKGHRHRWNDHDGSQHDRDAESVDRMAHPAVDAVGHQLTRLLGDDGHAPVLAQEQPAIHG